MKQIILEVSFANHNGYNKVTALPSLWCMRGNVIQWFLKLYLFHTQATTPPSELQIRFPPHTDCGQIALLCLKQYNLLVELVENHVLVTDSLKVTWSERLTDPIAARETCGVRGSPSHRKQVRTASRFTGDNKTTSPRTNTAGELDLRSLN